MRLLAATILVAFLFGCTKKTETQNAKQPKTTRSVVKIVNYESPLSFIYDESLVKNNVAYQIGETEYPLDQLYRSNKSLLRLVQNNRKFWAVSAYLQALAEKSKTNETVNLILPFPDEEIDLEALISEKGIDFDSSINVSFSEKEQLHGITKINDVAFDEVTLSRNNLDHARNLQKIFNLAMKEVETRASRIIITKKAQEKQQDFNDFIDQIASSSSAVTDSDVEQFAQENSIPESDLTETRTQTIRQIIASKRRSATLLSVAAKIFDGQTIRVAFFRPYLQPNLLAQPEGTPKQGNGKVEVTLISNFLCKRCVKTEQKLLEMFRGVSDKIQLSYLFQIRPEERISKFVAEAGLCVHRMDPSKFWDFHEETLREDFDGSETSIRQWLEAQGLSPDELTQCFSSRQSNKLLINQLATTQAAKSMTLPVVVINGMSFENPGDIEPLQTLIEHEFQNNRSSGDTGPTKGWLAWIRSLF